MRRNKNIDIETVMRALDAVNHGSTSRADAKILKAAGGTKWQGRRLVLALSPSQLAEKLGLAPGQVESRIDLDIAFARADTSGKATERHTSFRRDTGYRTGVRGWGSLNQIFTRRKTGR